MTSGRRSRARRRAIAVIVPQPPRRSRPCWRCGGGCRKDKHPYGWVCGVCADELDRYYVLLLGLRGGTVAARFAEDLAAGRVPPSPRVALPRKEPAQQI